MVGGRGACQQRSGCTRFPRIHLNARTRRATARDGEARREERGTLSKSILRLFRHPRALSLATIHHLPQHTLVADGSARREAGVAKRARLMINTLNGHAHMERLARVA